MGVDSEGMHTGLDGRRINGRQRTLTDAFAKIFPERASFEFREEDVDALRNQLRDDATGERAISEASQRQREATESAAWKEQHPCLLQNFPQFFKRAANKRVTVFLDYDGTLAPIVKDPDCAFMSAEMRETVRLVASLFPTAIISGRGREKVESFVQLKELFYAGSHGMDIVGPKIREDEEPISFQAAGEFAPVMDEVFKDLTERVRDIQGSSVEHNKFCVSVHFRNCEESKFEEVLEVVETVLSSHKDLRATRGRKVLEIRPEVEWNKGHALSHLLYSLDLHDSSADVLPIYIGDDRTDEDAFAVLSQNSRGVGILVSTKVKPTKATYRVRDPGEVRVFLDRLVRWGIGAENAWHKDSSCKGWALNKACLDEISQKYGTHNELTGSDPSAGFVSLASSRPPIHPRTSLVAERCHGSHSLQIPALANALPKPKQDFQHSNGSELGVLASVDIVDTSNLPASPFELHGQEKQKD